jgi:hypothetical protein
MPCESALKHPTFANVKNYKMGSRGHISLNGRRNVHKNFVISEVLNIVFDDTYSNLFLAMTRYLGEYSCDVIAASMLTIFHHLQVNGNDTNITSQT